MTFTLGLHRVSLILNLMDFIHALVHVHQHPRRLRICPYVITAVRVSCTIHVAVIQSKLQISRINIFVLLSSSKGFSNYCLLTNELLSPSFHGMVHVENDPYITWWGKWRPSGCICMGLSEEMYYFYFTWLKGKWNN